MKIKRRSFLIGTAVALASIPLRSVLAGDITSGEPIFDAHFHLFDPTFPIDANRGFTPSFFTKADYMKQAVPLGVRSGVLVGSSFQGYRQDWLCDGLAALGPEWVGITQLPTNVSDEEILRLDSRGVRGIRFNLYRGDEIPVSELVALAQRARDLAGWHPEVYLDASLMKKHVPELSKLPELVIDHLGMTEAGLPVLLDLVDAGAKVKASGFGRVKLDVPRALEKIAQRSSDALMFGSDLPSTRAQRPFHPDDIGLIKSILGPELARKALWSNGRSLYRLPLQAQASNTIQIGGAR
ncbi:amidohydrolase family protein [Pseudomonas sp. M2(2023)]|uniref:amidohydrolase family protein n=1 Tax=Pseudomonas sp. M2(2023) TaxID=3049084 RepID=UPI00255722F3|nr:amidohydrolase family protein [Pseudomonas sp. M2(2023)]WIV24064.1 amidohydrolase family protein [Pseudomonas sp. M2(2023)]